MIFEIYPDRVGKWRWRLVSHNGKTVADSGEGYARSANVRRAIRELREEILICPVKRTEESSIPPEPPYALPRP